MVIEAQKLDSMNFHKFKHLIKSDLYRCCGKVNISLFFKHYLFVPEYKYCFWMRLTSYLKQHRLFGCSLYYISRAMLYRYKCKYGITIPFDTQIGSGFYIGHFGQIVVNRNAVIGKNCNISQGVTIGVANRGDRKGCPTIGDNVYIGPGAKLFGNINVGNNVAIGANCVVTKDIPDDAVVVGVPGRVISNKGSSGYVNNTDYLKKCKKVDQ
ncbi:MAG: serine O-acetyltransferase [Phycisphaerae bacterium]|nr:serine O-acetyltransferase [Phycisphaerae bacterium]